MQYIGGSILPNITTIDNTCISPCGHSGVVDLEPPRPVNKTQKTYKMSIQNNEIWDDVLA